MNIVVGLPPNIEDIKKKLMPNEHTAFTYGDTLYAPKLPISADLLLHEMVHSQRQGKDPRGWWKEYLKDPTFRMVEEVAAYRAQYHWLKTNNREIRARFLRRLAGDLSSPLYGSVVSFADAVKIIDSNYE